jgi:hypothetical protein
MITDLQNLSKPQSLWQQAKDNERNKTKKQKKS